MTAANPNGPRALFMAAASRFRDEILLCLETYGPLTNKQITELTNTNTVKVRSKLAAMMAEGLVHADLVQGENCPLLAIYSLGPSEGGPKEGIKQRTVQKWKPPTIKHDPLHQAFFGQQKG